MNEVFILTKENHEYGDDIYIHDFLYYIVK